MVKYINRQNSESIVRLIINKQLEKYNVDYDYIKANPEIDGKPWYQYYTFDSEQEYNDWKDYCMELLTKQVRPKYSKELASKEFLWIDLMWGLKCNYSVIIDKL